VQEVLAMNAKDFVNGKDFSSSKGFPVGRTIIEFSNADFKQTEFVEDDGKTKLLNQVTIKVNGQAEVFNVPISVMRKIQEAIALNAAGVEVNRQGTTKNDTKYVSYILDQSGKIIK